MNAALREAVQALAIIAASEGPSPMTNDPAHGFTARGHQLCAELAQETLKKFKSLTDSEHFAAK